MLSIRNLFVWCWIVKNLIDSPHFGQYCSKCKRVADDKETVLALQYNGKLCNGQFSDYG